MTKMTYAKLIGYAVLLTGVVAISSAAGVMTAASEQSSILYQLTAFLVMGIFFTLRLRKMGAVSRLKGPAKSTSNKFVYLILLLPFIQPFMLGLDTTIAVSTICLTIIQMLLVGYTEELLFRVIYFEYLKKSSSLHYILFSSIVFGILHSAGGINPEASGLLVLLQVVNALLLGVVFAIVYVLSKNFHLLVLTHAVFNILASVTNTATATQTIATVLLLSGAYIVLILLLCGYSRRQQAL